MKNHHKIKLIAASAALAASFGASAGLGGLNVQSHLGEPFSATITVTGEEAKILANGGRVSISNSNLRASFRRNGGDNPIISIRSPKPIQDPVLIFRVGIGSQSREYTAIIDPAGYSRADGSSRSNTNSQSANQTPPATADAVSADAGIDRQAARERINRAVNSNNNEQESARKDGTGRKAAAEGLQSKANKAKAQQEAGGIVYGRRHVVRQGETLTGIASRIRPQGLTLAQTVQALVNANPDVFIGNDANRMLAGKALNIPSRSELNTYAGQAAPETKPSETPAAQPDTPAETAASSAKTTQPAGETAAQTDHEAAASVPQAAASETEAAEPVVQASEAEPVVQPAEEPALQQEETVGSEDHSLWRWLLWGGAGLLALFCLFKLLGKRKHPAAAKQPVEPVSAAAEKEGYAEYQESDTLQDFPDTRQNTVSATASAATAAVAGAAVAAAAHSAAKTGEGLEIADDGEDDFGDDIFFTEVEETAEDKQDGVDLDLNALDTEQAAIVSGAVTHDEETEKRRDADWDSIESTESVYEPDTENPYAVSPADAQYVSAEQAEETVAAADETVPAAQPVAEDSWEFDAAEPEAAEPEITDFQPEKAFEAEAVEGVAETTETPETWEFSVQEPEDVSEDGKVAPVAEIAEAVPFEAVAEEAGKDSVADTLAGAAVFEPVRTDDVEEFEKVSESADFEIEESASAKYLEVARADNVEIVGTPETGISAQAEPELFDIRQTETLAFQDSDDLKTEFAQVAESDETIEWENISLDETADGSRRESGFISESVGMTAPLEAKYELAKMYVEIGDPDAARETLQELIEESGGEILAKAREMLKELDA